MINKLKQLIVMAIISLPVARYFFYKYYVFRKPLEEKALRGKIQYLGHCIDLAFSDSISIPRAKIYELKPEDKKTCTSFDSDSIRKFEAIIKGRRSVRKWVQEEVSDSDIAKVIEWGTWAPSSCNRQPWQIMIITKDADKQEIAKYFPNKFYANAPLLLLVLIDSTLYGSIEKPFIYLDAAAFIQNLLLGFHILGYGACWVGFNGWNVFNESELHLPLAEAFYNNFRLAKTMVPASLIAAGRPAANPSAPARQSPQNILIYFNK